MIITKKRNTKILACLLFFFFHGIKITIEQDFLVIDSKLLELVDGRIDQFVDDRFWVPSKDSVF